jgi:hypothetical protein
LDLDENVEGRRRAALEDRLLGTTAARFFIAECDGLDAANEVGKRWIEDEIFESVTVRCGDQLDAPFSDGPCGGGLEVGADLIDDDDLRHVVLNRFDHHPVLQFRRGDLHPARGADARVRNIAVARDLVRGVDDDDTLVQIIGEEARNLTQHGGLTDTGPAQQKDALVFANEVFDDADRAEYRPADARGETNDPALTIADAGDAVECALDAGAVVGGEVTDAGDVFEVLLQYFAVAEQHLFPRVSGFGATSEIEDDFEKLEVVRAVAETFGDLRRENVDEEFEIVCDIQHLY